MACDVDELDVNPFFRALQVMFEEQRSQSTHKAPLIASIMYIHLFVMMFIAIKVCNGQLTRVSHQFIIEKGDNRHTPV